MKLSESKLKQIIKEELNRLSNEADDSYDNDQEEASKLAKTIDKQLDDIYQQQ